MCVFILYQYLYLHFFVYLYVYFVGIFIYTYVFILLHVYSGYFGARNHKNGDALLGTLIEYGGLYLAEGYFVPRHTGKLGPI